MAHERTFPLWPDYNGSETSDELLKPRKGRKKSPEIVLNCGGTEPIVMEIYRRISL